MRWLTVVFAVLFIAPATAGAAAPTVVTGPPAAVTKSALTATGTVDPKGLPTTYRVEYGPTELYGSTTAEVTAGDGTEPVPVSIPITGLQAGTAYRYRLVATNADGTSTGADQKVVTAAAAVTAARPPAAATKPVRDVQPTAVTLVATVNPRGLPTRYAFEYGVTPALGSRTAEAAAGSAAQVETVTRTLTRLQPATRYYVRVVATNSAGTIVGATRSFVTSRGLTSVLLSPLAPSILWGGGTTVRGRVTGAGVRGLIVAMERQDYPFRAPFREVKRRTTGADGAFFFPLDQVRSPARVRVVTRTSTPTTSPVVQVGTRLLVTVATLRAAPRRVTLVGTVRPGVGRGRVVAQRRTASGRWVTLQRARVRRINATRTRFRITVTRRTSTSRVRIVALPSDTRRYGRGESRVLRVAKRRR
ncbi:fibronectin type III domain-containing protein [Svornostia abyssi]|uniref:Fibronectin type III domain-containing protein n=1 Tax=Svornostia abyssi TaxID=2898438 RepID=A0ABY5PHA1_9ACTN|nr:fibronectin type III domain-containing protein [Parviterribacteraceae bacterium J379]